MTRLRMLDLFCCAGGAGMGYHRAGFDVVGVDINPQPNYPFEFHQGDALTYPLDGFDAVHASPPCHDHSALAACTGTDGSGWMLAATRRRLDAAGLPYVIENVQGADMIRSLTLCGEMFGLGVIRHRYFEISGFAALQPGHSAHRGRVSGWRHGTFYEGPYVAVYGEGGGKGSVAEWQVAMGIDWTADRKEIAEAIPPAYTAHPSPAGRLMGHYYADDAVTLYHGDSREILPTLDLPAPDVLILDPPFDLWADVPRIDARTVFAFTNLRSRAYPYTLYGEPRTEVIWYYRDGRWVSHRLPLISHTTILVYGSTGEVYVGAAQDTAPHYRGRQKPADLAAGRGSRARMVTPRSVYIPRARRALFSVIEAPARVATAGRFAKPEAVIGPLVEWAAGRTLLDPYCGAGTSLVVAKHLGMSAVGIDLDERSCELTARRLAQDALPFETAE